MPDAPNQNDGFGSRRVVRTEIKIIPCGILFKFVLKHYNNHLQLQKKPNRNRRVENFVLVQYVLSKSQIWELKIHMIDAFNHHGESKIEQNRKPGGVLDHVFGPDVLPPRLFNPFF